jgi:tRNA-dihydrouridine synthase
VEAVVREKGETVGVRESRSRAAYFIKGMRGAARVRDQLNHAETLAEFIKILETIGEE